MKCFIRNKHLEKAQTGIHRSILDCCFFINISDLYFYFHNGLVVVDEVSICVLNQIRFPR
jgi:hypothetical protein